MTTPNDSLLELERAFETARPRLTRMVRYRMDARLTGRIDPEDVLQEAWITMAKRATEFDATDEDAGFVWIRGLTLQTMVDLHPVSYTHLTLPTILLV